MQPLDKSIMGALKVYYSEEIRIFIRTKQRPLTQLAEVFGRAYLKVQSGFNAKKGFEAMELYPGRRNIFEDSDFLAAEQNVLMDKPDNNVSASNEQPHRNLKTENRQCVSKKHQPCSNAPEKERHKR